MATSRLPKKIIVLATLRLSPYAIFFSHVVVDAVISVLVKIVLKLIETF